MKLKILTITFLLLFLFSTSYLMYTSVKSYYSDEMQKEMSENIREDNVSHIKKIKGTEILPKFLTNYEKNPQFAGWIRIDDTMIDYPVMKPIEDNNFYLTHGPDRKKSKYGAIYLDISSNLLSSSTNWIIYGHYFADGSMFGMLKNYKNQDFYKKHPFIQFDTIYEEGVYEIIAVFVSQVYRKNQDVFKYYQYTNIETKAKFDEYVSNIEKLSLYQTGRTAEYGDSLITLSTCDYWTENGRLAVVAKRVDSTD
ncbi:class B sortase [Anaerovorax odorimutans]|uniref:class B sortase n=1 Tax=Anaerovorax odorimutans TaxID=109327 RepID=UPI0004293A3E|nr:class B sortase [Anaerovorax odorimutans]